jgi:DNA polymerase-3 subunit alpha
VREADEIFGWIEKSQRYSFNKSHAVSYAINAYLSAYTKAHFPKVFFASYLKFAKDKIDPQQEIKELVKNASEMDVEVRIPDIRLLNKLFIIKDKNIYFGLTDIKGVGESVYDKLLGLTENFDFNSSSWLQISIKILMKINSTAAKALISGGALDFTKKNRTEMLFELEILSQLTSKELEHLMSIIISSNKTSITECMRLLLDHPKINKKRKDVILGLVDTLLRPPYSLIDKIEWLSDTENSLLGVSISCSKLDSYDTSMANTNCKDFKTSHFTNNVIIAGEIINVNIVKTKNGKNPGAEMAFVSIEDQAGILDSIIFFPEQLQLYKTHLFNSNILVFIGSKSKTKDGLVVEKCFTPMS